MSGGTFEYKNNYIGEIAEELQEYIDTNDDIDYPFSQATINEFVYARNLLVKADKLVHRIDWLIAGDDGEETFHRLLKEDRAGK